MTWLANLGFAATINLEKSEINPSRAFKILQARPKQNPTNYEENNQIRLYTTLVEKYKFTKPPKKSQTNKKQNTSWNK